MTEPDRNREKLGSVLLAGLAFGVALGATLRVVTGSWRYGFHGFVLGGFLFGFALYKVIGVQLSRPPASVEGLDDGETIVHHGPANHFKGAVAVGGKLFLTNKRLRFRAHRLNVRAHDESYALSEVASAGPARTFGIVPNGLRVDLRDGRRERFVVTARARWVASIREQVALEASPRGADATD